MVLMCYECYQKTTIKIVSVFLPADVEAVPPVCKSIFKGQKKEQFGWPITDQILIDSPIILIDQF